LTMSPCWADWRAEDPVLLAYERLQPLPEASQIGGRLRIGVKGLFPSPLSLLSQVPEILVNGRLAPPAPMMRGGLLERGGVALGVDPDLAVSDGSTRGIASESIVDGQENELRNARQRVGIGLSTPWHGSSELHLELLGQGRLERISLRAMLTS